MKERFKRMGCKLKTSKYNSSASSSALGSGMSILSSHNNLKQERLQLVLMTLATLRITSLLLLLCIPSRHVEFGKLHKTKQKVFIHLESNLLEQYGEILQVDYSMRTVFHLVKGKVESRISHVLIIILGDNRRIQ
jgi:hypothetical protein